MHRCNGIWHPRQRSGTSRNSLRNVPNFGTFLRRCCLLYRRGQVEKDRLCIRAVGRLRAQLLHECHGRQLGGLFGREKTWSLFRSLAFWVGQDVDVADAPARRASTPRQTMTGRAGSFISSSCSPDVAG